MDRRDSLKAGSAAAASGGTGAVWIRTQLQPGTVQLTARHPRLGEQRVTFQRSPATPEQA